MDNEPLQGNLAAVDLGSNSFHMVIARVVEGELQLLDRLKEPVRLAAGLDRKGQLDSESKARAIACLQRFGQRLRGVPPGQIRAVGTNTFRSARDSRQFLAEVQRALNHPVEILPGREEARLIYLGAAHTLDHDERKRLVVDIGGGSTECVVGEGFETLVGDSLYMGCVTHTHRFFGKGRVTRAQWKKAVVAAERELQTLEEQYRTIGWQQAVGTSGTIRAVAEILRAQEWCDEGVTAAGLERLVHEILAAEEFESLKLKGLQEDRRPVLAGGVAILTAAFHQLNIEKMSISSGALREGLLYDLLGRIRHEDPRNRTIRHLCERYSIDARQAHRVEDTALELWKPLAKPWNLDSEEARHLLIWSCRLHELGLAVNYSGHHKHGAYLITHAEMPGFSWDDQQVLAAIIRCHRRRLDPNVFRDLAPRAQLSAQGLCVILRLSVLLNRGRGHPRVPIPKVHVKDRKLGLKFEAPWLHEHPLTQADLEEEIERLRTLGIDLQIADG